MANSETPCQDCDRRRLAAFVQTLTPDQLTRLRELVKNAELVIGPAKAQ